MSWTLQSSCPWTGRPDGRDSPGRPVHGHCPVPLPALTILVHAILALQVCLCLEANANPLRIHQITVHNQWLHTDWKHWLFQQRALVSPGLHLCVLVRLASATHSGSMPMPIGKVYHGVFIALSLFQQRALVSWGLHLGVSVIAKLNWHQSRILSGRIYSL